MWPKQFKLWKAPAMVSSIMVVSAQTYCALLYDLKAIQTNMQCSPIWWFILWVQNGRNFVEVTQDICFTIDEDAIDHSTVSRWSWNSTVRLSSNESVLTHVMNYEVKWNYMDIGTFHYSKVAKSISWTVISCWPSEWAY